MNAKIGPKSFDSIDCKTATAKDPPYSATPRRRTSICHRHSAKMAPGSEREVAFPQGVQPPLMMRHCCTAATGAACESDTSSAAVTVAEATPKVVPLAPNVPRSVMT